MKVLIDRRLRVRGVKRYSEELTEALRGLPQNIVIETLDPGGLGLAPFTPWGRKRVALRAREQGVDLIHGLHFEVPSSPIPSVVTVQDLIPLEHPASMPNPIRRVIFRQMVGRSTSNARRVIASSEATKRALIRFGADEAKLRVVPLWPSPVFEPLDEHQKQEAKQRFGGGASYIAALYHPRAHKNLATLISAAPLINRDSGSRIVIAGIPRESSGIMSARTPSDDDLRHFIGGAELFVLPSIIEGFGLPAVESLACGTMVVCGVGLGALPYCDRGVALTNVADPGALSRKVIDLLQDPVSINRLAEAGRAQVSQLSSRRAAEETYRIYLETLEDEAD